MSILFYTSKQLPSHNTTIFLSVGDGEVTGGLFKKYSAIVISGRWLRNRLFVQVNNPVLLFVGHGQGTG